MFEYLTRDLAMHKKYAELECAIMKKVISMFLVMALMLSMGIGALAASATQYSSAALMPPQDVPHLLQKSTQEKIDCAVALGISESDAKKIPEDILGAIITENKAIEGYTSTFSTIIKNPKERVIDPNNLFIFNSVSKNTSKSNATEDYYDVVTYAKWLKDPVFRFRDCIATAWSSDFSLYTDSCLYSKDAYQTISSYGIRSMVAPNVGVAHIVDITVGSGNYIKQQLTIFRTKQASAYNVNVVTSYAHKTISISGVDITARVSAQPSIGFSIGTAATFEEGSPCYSKFTVSGR